MRTRHRRSLAFAATCLPVLLGVGLVAGASPAVATTAASDCGATATGPDGHLDADLLQACLLDQVESSLTPEEVPVASPPKRPRGRPRSSRSLPDVLDEPVASVDAGPVVEDVEPGGGTRRRVGRLGRPAGLRVRRRLRDKHRQRVLRRLPVLPVDLAEPRLRRLPPRGLPRTQDQAAIELQSLYGWSQWPGCSWYLGLGDIRTTTSSQAPEGP